jgi:hypothetical protein
MYRAIGNVLSLGFLGVMSTFLSATCRSANASAEEADLGDDIAVEESGERSGGEALTASPDVLTAGAPMDGCRGCDGEGTACLDGRSGDACMAL